MDISPDTRFWMGVDELFYRAASENLENAYTAKKKVDSELDKLNSSDWYEEFVRNDWGDEIDIAVVADQEELSKIKESEKIFRENLEKYIEHVALVHISSVTSLEAHINEIAQQVLSESDFETFVWKKIKDKWTDLPQEIAQNTFETGRQPFQNFIQLLKFRNALVHHKRDEKLTLENIKDNDPNGLGLTIEAAENSLKTVELMINQIHQFLSDNDISQKSKSFSLGKDYIKMILND
ncbi:hypothetical protein LX73_0162 [Fodinibius salinus]|uniref:RiboL-PSP-HEPN domain-containing protein n=1 Tax=Fodinibius salinus TaxID=860790 RepID=A0A5D3YM85_9BACT|nr:hypothetical protein [Fodinibius salinus]TYP94872.1 hypothetical protein LX73_0162 [Fodinibius salinus]